MIGKAYSSVVDSYDHGGALTVTLWKVPIREVNAPSDELATFGLEREAAKALAVALFAVAADPGEDGSAAELTRRAREERSARVFAGALASAFAPLLRGSR